MNWVRSRLGLLAGLTCIVIVGAFGCDFNFDRHAREGGADASEASNASMDPDAADAGNSLDSGSSHDDITFEGLTWLVPILCNQ